MKTPPAPLIELSHCSLILDDHVVLDDVSFSLRAGERWALVGANGSGKTMLLKLLRGDMWPTPTGHEQRTYALGTRGDREATPSKDLIAYVGPERQDKYVRYGWDLTVAQVVTTGLFDEDIPLSRPTSAQRSRVARTLRRFGLWKLRERRMLSLSYGQRRLALVARAFAGPARVLLLDEVFNGLDDRTRARLRAALELPRGGHDWILTTHRPKELPANITHLARIAGGKLLDASPVDSRGSAQPRRRRKRRFVALPQASRANGKDRRSKEPWLVRVNEATIYRDYRPVIRDLNWTLMRHEHWAILGRNGSGKSTLLSLIHGDLHPALGGSVQRATLPKGAHIEGWKRTVGWVSPELQADHYLAESIEEIVISGRYASVGLNQPPTRTDRSSALRWMKFFGIQSLRARGPRQVSYGQMRLALFARAMVNDPQLLLLDEPCTGLDGDVRGAVLELIELLARHGTQIVMAVHDPEDIVPSVTRVLRILPGGRAVVGELR